MGYCPINSVVEHDADNDNMNQVNAIAVLAHGFESLIQMPVFESQVFYQHKYGNGLNDGVYAKVTVHGQIQFMVVFAEEVGEKC